MFLVMQIPKHAVFNDVFENKKHGGNVSVSLFFFGGGYMFLGAFSLQHDG